MLRGYFLFSLDKAVELKAQDGHCVRLFRGLSESIIDERLTVERVGDVEDSSLVSACTTPFQLELCRPVDICYMGQRSFVMDCGALEDVLRGARAGAVLVLAFFPPFSCLSMHKIMCLSVSASSTCGHPCPI